MVDFIKNKLNNYLIAYTVVQLTIIYIICFHTSVSLLEFVY